MRNFANSPNYAEHAARVMEYARGLRPPLPVDDDEQTAPRFGDLSDRNKIAAVAEYTARLGPGWVDDAFCDIKREDLLAAYSQGPEAFSKLLREAFERYAGSIIDRAIDDGLIDF